VVIARVPSGAARVAVGADAADAREVGVGTAMRALVGQPIPSAHCAWTRNVCRSNSLAVAENLLAAYATL